MPRYFQPHAIREFFSLMADSVSVASAVQNHRPINPAAAARIGIDPARLSRLSRY